MSLGMFSSANTSSALCRILTTVANVGVGKGVGVEVNVGVGVGAGVGVAVRIGKGVGDGVGVEGDVGVGVGSSEAVSVSGSGPAQADAKSENNFTPSRRQMMDDQLFIPLILSGLFRNHMPREYQRRCKCQPVLQLVSTQRLVFSAF